MQRNIIINSLIYLIICLILSVSIFIRGTHCNFNEVTIHHWINKLSSEENKIPDEARKVAGSATYKQSMFEIV